LLRAGEKLCVKLNACSVIAAAQKAVGQMQSLEAEWMTGQKPGHERSFPEN
jgi:hypothetical protein